MSGRPDEDALVAEGLTRRFDDRLALDDVSSSVNRGEVCGFLGPNGAGKTTTARMLNQFQQGLDLARAENRKVLEGALTRQLGANQLDVEVAAAQSALKHDPGLKSPMLAELGRRAKAAGLEAVDKGNHVLAIKRLDQATRLLPADEDVRAKLEQAKESAAQVSAPK